ncbi:putative nucleotidyltransferase, Ribonuclease H [Helianthus annuus]|nr:putative nucleotidyltransferase, Ribonuclease H [Helianthus annuus]
MQLGSFDVIVGMDWLAKYRAEIVCFEKIIRMPLSSGEILQVRGEKPAGGLKLMSCFKARKYLRKNYVAFLAHVVADKGKGKSIQDIPVVRDYSEVFPEDLPGLPPARQVEFRIDLVPGANPIARAPYRLAPSEMQELSKQLQELSNKGFIRPSFSPWGAPVLFVKKRMDPLGCVSIIVSLTSLPSRIDIPYLASMISLINCKALLIFQRLICDLDIINSVCMKKIFPRQRSAHVMDIMSSQSCHSV